MICPPGWSESQTRAWDVLGSRVQVQGAGCGHCEYDESDGGLFRHCGECLAAGCWEWQGALNGRGYGVMRHRGKLVLTHRLALRSALGRPLKRGKLVLHSCHNRKCCNPEHLSEGTPSRNQLDRWARQRVTTLQE